MSAKALVARSPGAGPPDRRRGEFRHSLRVPLPLAPRLRAIGAPLPGPEKVLDRVGIPALRAVSPRAGPYFRSLSYDRRGRHRYRNFFSELEAHLRNPRGFEDLLAAHAAPALSRLVQRAPWAEEMGGAFRVGSMLLHALAAELVARRAFRPLVAGRRNDSAACAVRGPHA